MYCFIVPLIQVSVYSCFFFLNTQDNCISLHYEAGHVHPTLHNHLTTSGLGCLDSTWITFSPHAFYYHASSTYIYILSALASTSQDTAQHKQHRCEDGLVAAAGGKEDQQSWRKIYNSPRESGAKSLKFWVRWPPEHESNFIPAHLVTPGTIKNYLNMAGTG